MFAVYDSEVKELFVIFLYIKLNRKVLYLLDIKTFQL